MTAAPVIVGVDEAGRGALAGPVVAGACVQAEQLAECSLIRDSKALSPEQRAEAYDWITAHCTWGVGIVANTVIDTDGILAATEQAMQAAVAQIAEHVVPTYLLIDGRDKFWFDYPHSSVIKGDQKELCIAAGSIVAKVTRDRLVSAYDTEFPAYKFSEHKGYGTAEHYGAITTHGVTALHRQTFLHLAA